MTDAGADGRRGDHLYLRLRRQAPLLEARPTPVVGGVRRRQGCGWHQYAEEEAVDRLHIASAVALHQRKNEGCVYIVQKVLQRS